jgi:ubiquinone/menaquinone biosynthesis C-methylase UbiE
MPWNARYTEERPGDSLTILIPSRRFDPADPEYMDRPGADPEILSEDLRNLRVINRLFGGLSAVQRSIIPLFHAMEKGREVRILDLATGSADHPIALANLARARGDVIHITAVDKNPHMVEIARERTAGYSNIIIEQQDLLSLPYPSQSFDIVLCSLAIHHFSRGEVVRILQTMNKISRTGYIVNDLNRSWIGAWTAWLYTHSTTRNPMTLHDSHISVLRAFTPDELRSMAEEATLRRYRISTQPFFRLILVGTHNINPPS